MPAPAWRTLRTEAVASVGTDDQEADEVAYDHTSSGLSANTVQEALDELDGRADATITSIDFDGPEIEGDTTVTAAHRSIRLASGAFKQVTTRIKHASNPATAIEVTLPIDSAVTEPDSWFYFYVDEEQTGAVTFVPEEDGTLNEKAFDHATPVQAVGAGSFVAVYVKTNAASNPDMVATGDTRERKTVGGILDLLAAMNFAKGANIASATTTDIGAATGNVVDVTGNVTITGLGTIQAGTWRLVRFTGAPLLTHNGTSLILPTAANIQAAAGDVAALVSLGSGNWFCAGYMKASGRPVREMAALVIACGDETTALTTGAAKTTFRMPFAMAVTEVRGGVTTAPTGASLLTVDVNEGGVGNSILSTKLTFNASSKTTVGASTPAVISDSALADDAEITIDIDQVGSTIAGAGLKVTLIGYRTS
jgi:hypothetical protein